MRILIAFIIGGALCAIGQFLILRTTLTPARILTGYVCVGVFTRALGLYEPFAEWAGAGASVPLTGFGNQLARGVERAVERDGFLGVLSGGLGGCAVGITAAILFSLLAALCFRSSPKVKRKN